VHLEYAALARGDDPTLAAAVEAVERTHIESLGLEPREPRESKTP
jgi:hypothetical protein